MACKHRLKNNLSNHGAWQKSMKIVPVSKEKSTLKEFSGL